MSRLPLHSRPRGRVVAWLAAAVWLAGASHLGCASRAKEAELGASEHEKIVMAMGLVQDPELVEYVGSIGARLVRHTEASDTVFRFFIVDRPEPNAFALPGGFVYVSRGLLSLVNSEDELAGVMGHEIGHVTARHAVKRVGVASPFMIATGLAGFATGIVSPRLANVITGTSQAITDGLVVAPFSRSQENEADEIGIELAARSGWDPEALPRFLALLDRDSTLEQGKERQFHILDTHPMTPDRVRKTKELAARIEPAPAAPIAVDRADLLRRLDGLVLGPDPLGGVFIEERFLQPAMAFAITFPKQWQYRNARQGVYAKPEKGDVVIGLEVTGRSDDPWDQVGPAEERRGKPLPVTEMLIGDLKAVRTTANVQTRDGVRAFDVTWIAYGGLIYGVWGITKPDDAEAWAPVIRDVATSFRPITGGEVAEIRESRLRVAAARGEERLEALLARYGSDWSVEKMAIANDIDARVPARPGFPLKVSIPQPYTPR